MWSAQFAALKHLFDEPTIANTMANLKLWIGASCDHAEVAECASQLKELFAPYGTTVFISDSNAVDIDDYAVKLELKDADFIAMLAVTIGVSAEALELFATVPEIR